jgi:hypothetical protein
MKGGDPEEFVGSNRSFDEIKCLLLRSNRHPQATKEGIDHVVRGLLSDRSRVALDASLTV